MRILRLESIEGRGVFDLCVASSRMYTAIPNPPRESKIQEKFDSRYFFGFPDLNVMLRYVDEDDFLIMLNHAKTINVSIGLSEYEVDEEYAVNGDSQSIFMKEKAERKCWIPLSEFVS